MGLSLARCYRMDSPGSTREPKLSALWLVPGHHGKLSEGHDWPFLTSSRCGMSQFSDHQCQPGKEPCSSCLHA